MRWLAGAQVCLVGLGALAQEAAGTLPFFRLERGDRTITVQQGATDAQGGIFVNNGQGCGRPDSYFSTVYAPAPELVSVRVNDTLITGNIVLREQPQGQQERATLDISGGTLVFDEETFCPKEVERSDKPLVTLVQERTTVRGSRVLYDNATGVFDMRGPIDLQRRAQGDSPALAASAEALSYGVDEDLIVLKGGVTVTSEDRESHAERLEYDEEAGVAVMHGAPAVSVQGGNRVEGETIVYYLDSNDVVVEGGVAATLEYGGEAPGEAGTGGAASP